MIQRIISSVSVKMLELWIQQLKHIFRRVLIASSKVIILRLL
jgi:hypothetical protein